MNRKASESDNSSLHLEEPSQICGELGLVLPINLLNKSASNAKVKITYLDNKTSCGSEEDALLNNTVKVSKERKSVEENYTSDLKDYIPKTSADVAFVPEFASDIDLNSETLQGNGNYYREENIIASCKLTPESVSEILPDSSTSHQNCQTDGISNCTRTVLKSDVGLPVKSAVEILPNLPCGSLNCNGGKSSGLKTEVSFVSDSTILPEPYVVPKNCRSDRGASGATDHIHCSDCQCGECSLKSCIQAQFHHVIADDTEEVKYTCNVCGRTFHWISHLWSHECAADTRVVSHENNNSGRFKCEDCGKHFASNHSLKRHGQICLNESKKIHCEFCGKKVVSEENLEKHKNIHTTKGPYKCDLCDKKFQRKTNCNVHIKHVHKGLWKEKQYLCTVCGNLYRTNRELKTHFIKHTDERPFICRTCGKTYRSNTSLKAHENMHLGIKPFSCNVCGRTFLNYGNKLKHQRRHSDFRPHKCNLCEKAFYEKQELERHIQRHHSQPAKT